MKGISILVLLIFLIQPIPLFAAHPNDNPVHPISPVQPNMPNQTWYNPNVPINLNYDHSKKISSVDVLWNDSNGTALGSLYINNGGTTDVLIASHEVGNVENVNFDLGTNQQPTNIYILFARDSAQLLSYTINYVSTGGTVLYINFNTSRYVNTVVVRWRTAATGSHSGTLYVDNVAKDTHTLTNNGVQTAVFEVYAFAYNMYLQLSDTTIQIVNYEVTYNMYYYNNTVDYYPTDPNNNNSNWFLVNDVAYINVSANRVVQYVSIRWSDYGGNTWGRLSDAAGNIYYPDLWVPDNGAGSWDSWTVNRSTSWFAIQVFNNSAQIFQVRVTYSDYWNPYPSDIPFPDSYPHPGVITTVVVHPLNPANNTSVFNTGEVVTLNTDSSRYISYVTVNWADYGGGATGTMTDAAGNNYGSKDVGDQNDTDTWSNINRTTNKLMITMSGNNAQFISVTIAYGPAPLPTHEVVIPNNQVVNPSSPTHPNGY
ncbi:MAG: hypothetical protein PHW04_12340 [Candidatus Wallbacteria bacterium]|nr:hypothetical protein [Candidatus Wallbacteria bacterium]